MSRNRHNNRSRKKELGPKHKTFKVISTGRGNIAFILCDNNVCLGSSSELMDFFSYLLKIEPEDNFSQTIAWVVPVNNKLSGLYTEMDKVRAIHVANSIIKQLNLLLWRYNLSHFHFENQYSLF